MNSSRSTQILGSIRGVNQINPVDVAAFRRPGAEIKEGLIPVNMFYVAQDLSDSLSMEAFYQLEWAKTVIDNCGTFYSSTDVAADGCNDRNLIFGSDFDHYFIKPGLSHVFPIETRQEAYRFMGSRLGDTGQRSSAGSTLSSP